MDRKAFHIVKKQGMHPKQMIQGGYGEVAEMFVVNGIEFAMVDEILHVGHLDNRDAVVLQQETNALNETVQIGNVGEDVVADDHVGSLATCRPLPSETLAKKRTERRHTDLLRRPGRALGRVNAENRDAMFNKVLQQVTVVAGQFNDQAVRVQSTVFDQVKSISPGML